MKDMFEHAILTDMHIFTDEPDAMIGLITFEAIAADIDKAIQLTLIEQVVNETSSQVLEMLMKMLS